MTPEQAAAQALDSAGITLQGLNMLHGDSIDLRLNNKVVGCIDIRETRHYTHAELSARMVAIFKQFLQTDQERRWTTALNAMRAYMRERGAEAGTTTALIELQEMLRQVQIFGGHSDQTHAMPMDGYRSAGRGNKSLAMR